MSAAKSSLGSQFLVESATAGTYVSIEEIIDIPSILGDKAGKVDVTNMDSAGYKEFIFDGLREAPEVSFKCNFTNGTGQQRIKTLADSGAMTSLKLILSNKATPTGAGTTIVRSGFITSRAITAGKGSQLILEFTIQFSGAPTETAAS